MDVDSDEEETVTFTEADIAPLDDVVLDIGNSSDTDSVGSVDDDILEDEVVENSHVPSGYSHDWLIDFDEVVGPIGLADNVSEVDVFRLFMTDYILNMVTETNVTLSRLVNRRDRLK